MFIMAGLLAAGVVWVVNRFYLANRGPGAIIYLVPLLEETAKSGFAVYLNAPIFYSHAVFGVVEGVLDIYSGHRRAISAGWVSYIGHMLFGFLAQWFYLRTGSLWTAIFSAYLVHMTWNGFVMKVLVFERR